MLKVRVAYEVELTDAMVEKVMKDAREMGSDYDDPGRGELIRRHLIENGTEALAEHDPTLEQVKITPLQI
jgi:hypothetical protein